MSYKLPALQLHIQLISVSYIGGRFAPMTLYGLMGTIDWAVSWDSRFL